MAPKPSKPSKPARAAKPVQTGGARHPGRPETQTPAQRAGKSEDTVPMLQPQEAAPEPKPGPAVTAPIPEHTRPRTHKERNA